LSDEAREHILFTPPRAKEGRVVDADAGWILRRVCVASGGL
jgi:hypothetical protein